jgi:hypothetical protein
MQVPLPRYRRWWWIIFLFVGAVAATIIGMMVTSPEETPAAKVQQYIHQGMTYRQVNEQFHRFGWRLQHTREEAEYCTWQNASGGQSIWVDFDKDDRVKGSGVDFSAGTSLFQRLRNWTADTFVRIASR